MNNSDVIGPDQDDFTWAGPFTSNDCSNFAYGQPNTLAPGDSCGFGVIFSATEAGPHHAD